MHILIFKTLKVQADHEEGGEGKGGIQWEGKDKDLKHMLLLVNVFIILE